MNGHERKQVDRKGNERKGNKRKWKEMITANSKETLESLNVLSVLPTS